MNLELNATAPEVKFTIKRIIFLCLALFLYLGFSAGIVRAENGKIAYAYANAIYKMNADGTNVQQLTTPSAESGYDRDFSPVWSPNGAKLAFVRVTSETTYTTGSGGGGLDSEGSYYTVYTYAIYTIDYNGGNLTQIKTSPYFINDLSWSPDGTRLAYVHGGDTTFAGTRQNCGGNSYIYTIEAVAGGAFARIAATASGIDPSWSPDGTKIFYAVNNNSELYGIYSVNLSTNDVQRLTFDILPPADPEVSPDGSKIAYAIDYPEQQCLFGNMSTMGPTRMQIYTGSLILYNISQNNSVILTNRASSPVWHPGGNTILFVSSGSNGEWSEQPAEPDLATISAAGTNLTLIQNWQIGELSGSWSP